MRILLFLALVALAVHAKRYDGYKIIDIMPTTKTQVRFLRHMMLNNNNLDFWEEPRATNKRVRLMAHQDYLNDFVYKELPKAALKYTVFDEDVQATVDAEMAGIMQRRAQRSKVFDLDDFNTLADTYDWLTEQAATCATGLTCSLTNLGSSFEGRDIWLFTISAGSGRQAYYLDSMTHAREWLTSATNAKIIDHILSNYGSDADVNAAMNYDWHILLIQNPDGYEYSWTNERLWRKNRNNDLGGCIGVDLNRNYDFRWGNEGVSHSPCSDTYCGPSGGSEPETQAVMNFLNGEAANIVAMITLHSYGEYWMFPWGNTVNYAGGDPFNCERTSDFDELQRVADAACDAIQATSGGLRWACGTSCEEIYPTTGATDDWSKGVAGITYTYNPELRGNSFVIDASQIQPSFEETWAALVATVDAVENP